MPHLIHHLTHPGELTASTVVCGDADAALATWDPQQVTCPACQRQCTCGPGVRLCDACRAYNAAHPGQPKELPDRPPVRTKRPSSPYRAGKGPRRRRARYD